MVYFGKRYTSAVTVSRTVDVRCEKCGCAYRYQLVRRGTGWALAPYMIGAWSGAERARRRATRLAQRRLAKAAEPVPCPDCGWFQADMVRDMARRSSRWLTSFAVVLPALTVIVLAVVLLLGTDGFQRSFAHLMDGNGGAIWALIAFAILSPLIVLGLQVGLRTALQQGSRLNRAYPTRPAPIDGAPSAIRTAGGRPGALVSPPPITAPPSMPGGGAGWISVQLLNIAFPAMCVLCATPTSDTRTYHRVKGALVKFHVPICPTCRHHNRTWLWTASAGGAILGALPLLPRLLTVDAAGWSETASALALLSVASGAVALIVTVRIRRPIRFRNYSADRNTVQLWFANQAYTEGFVAVNRATAVRATMPQLNRVSSGVPASSRRSSAARLGPPPMPTNRPASRRR